MINIEKKKISHNKNNHWVIIILFIGIVARPDRRALCLLLSVHLILSGSLFIITVRTELIAIRGRYE